MAIEFDDRAINIIGTNHRALNFYDDARQLRASIFLDGQGNLNVGNLQVSVSDNGSGGSSPPQPPPALDIKNHPFLGLAPHAGLTQERIFKPGVGLEAVDSGAGRDYTVSLGTPGTLSAQTANDVTASSHTHGVTASADPGPAESLLKSSPSGGLTLELLDVDNVRLDGNSLRATVGDLTLDAADGDVVLPSPVNVGADNFVSQLTGWRVTYDGQADFRFLYADELHVRAFIADIEQALAGGQIISKSVARLAENFYVPMQNEPIANISQVAKRFVVNDESFIGKGVAAGDTITVSGSTGNDGDYTVASVHGTTSCIITVNEAIPDATIDGTITVTKKLITVEDLEGFPDTQVFANNDWLRLRVIDRSGGGLIVSDVWGTVSGYTDNADGTQTWDFALQSGASLENKPVYAGSIVLDYGQSGDGWHEITTLDPDSPYSQIVTWTTDPTNPANYTLRSRLGNLDGVTDGNFPSIGGWGLYSTNAFLKGDLIAAGGDVEITGDGIRMDALQGKYSSASIEWYDSTTREFSIGTIVDLGSVTGAYMESQDSLSLISTSGEVILQPSTFVDVKDDMVVTGDITIGGSGDKHLNIKDSSGNNDRVLMRQDSTDDVYFGDVDNNGGAVHFRSAGTTRMTISSSGFVGIGTTSPTNGRLEIAEVGTAIYISGGGEIRNNNGSIELGVPVEGIGGWARGLFWQDRNNWGTNLGAVGMFGTGTDPDRIFLSWGSSPWNGTTGITVTDAGKVGINRAGPNTDLHLHNPSDTAVALQLTHSTTGTAAGDGGRIDVTSGGDIRLMTFEAADMILLTSGANRWRIKANGSMIAEGLAGQGNGTINAQAVYDNGTLLTDWVFDLWLDGDTEEEVTGTGRLWNIEETRQFVGNRRHLPALPGRAAWKESKASLGELVNGLWETVEQQAIHIFELETRVNQLEAQLA